MGCVSLFFPSKALPETRHLHPPRLAHLFSPLLLLQSPYLASKINEAKDLLVRRLLPGLVSVWAEPRHGC